MYNNKTLNLDQEWIDLMKEAREIGISKDEIKAFLSNNRKSLQAKTLQKVLD